MNGYSGGTIQGQHYRTLDMLENMIEDKKPLNEILWFLYDIQTQHKDLKELAILRKAQEK